MKNFYVLLAVIFATGPALSATEKPILMRYEGTPLPVMEYIEPGTADYSSYVLKRSFYSARFRHLLPYNLEASRPQNYTIPSSSLIFQTLGEFYAKGVLQANLLAALDTNETTKEVRLKLDPAVEFYWWDENSNELQSTQAKAADLLFSLGLHRKLWEAHGYAAHYAILISSSVDVENDEVVLGFEQTTPLHRINEMLMYIVAQTALVPKSIYGDLDFANSRFAQTPVGVGPYYVKPGDIDESGDVITYHRVNNHWSQKVDPDQNQYRFEKIRFTSYLDSFAHTLALQAGDLSFFASDEYLEALNTLEVIGSDQFTITAIPAETPTQLWLDFNLEKWTNPNVRKAIGLLVRDYQKLSSSKAIHGTYSLSQSMFPNSEYFGDVNTIDNETIDFLAEKGLSEETLIGLQEPPHEFSNTLPDRSGRRAVFHKVIELLTEEGFQIDSQGQMIDPTTGQPMKIHAVAASGSVQEKLLNLAAENFKRVGIELSVQSFDHNSLKNIIQNRNFDIKIEYYYFPDLPVMTLFKALFHSSGKFEDTSGMKDSSIDEIIEKMALEKNLNDIKPFAQALNKALIGRSYKVPLLYSDQSWIIHDKRIAPGNSINNRIDSSVTRGWMLNSSFE